MWAVLECTSHYNEYERLDLLKCATHGPSRLLDNKLTLSLLYFELSIIKLRQCLYKRKHIYFHLFVFCLRPYCRQNYQIDPTFLYIVPGCPTTSYISGPYV
jgi:hypothetical protein